MFIENITETESFIITRAVKQLLNVEIENSIIDISEKIPDKNTTIELINDDKTKNWREYIGYDSYIYHTKYDAYENNIDNNIKYDFNGYCNLIYIKSCAWLLDECTNLIKNIVNNQKYEYKKIFDQNLELYKYYAFINSYKNNYDNIINNWNENKKQLPLKFIIDIFKNKGYKITLIKDKDNFYLKIKINSKREREN